MSKKFRSVFAYDSTSIVGRRRGRGKEKLESACRQGEGMGLEVQVHEKWRGTKRKKATGRPRSRDFNH